MADGTTLVDRKSKLTSAPGHIEEAVRELHPYYEEVSRSFCAERDLMNRVFRDFVTAYAMAIGESDVIELSIASTLVWPLHHTLSVVNRYALTSWLPEPRLYSLQVKSELRYQAKRFIAESLAALDRIETTQDEMQRATSSDSSSQSVDLATHAIWVYQRDLTEQIERIKRASYWTIFFQPKAVRALEKHRALSHRIQDSLASLLETKVLYQADHAKLRTGLNQLRAGFRDIAAFDLSPQGRIALPRGLEHRSSWLQPIEGESPSTYYYNMDMAEEVNLSTIRWEIAQSCKGPTNTQIISGSLWMICNTWHYATIMSGLEDDLLTGVQRSWVLERKKARDRFQKEIRADDEYVAKLAAKVYNDFVRGTAVPEYIH